MTNGAFERPFLAKVYKKPSHTRRNTLDCEFDNVPEAVGWIYDYHPNRLGADIFLQEYRGKNIVTTLVWSEQGKAPPKEGQCIILSKGVNFPSYGFSLDAGICGTYRAPALGLDDWRDDLHIIEFEGITGFAIWLQADEFALIPDEDGAGV